MQNNSNNNGQDWRQRLEDFEDSSAGNLDINAAWEKLQSKKPAFRSSSRSVGFWLLAAAVIGIMIFTLLQLSMPSVQTKEPDMVMQINPPFVIQADKVNVETSPVIAVEKTLIPISTKTAKPLPPVHVRKNTGAPSGLAMVKEIEVFPIIESVDSSAKKSAPVMAVAKKLKVVHINELSSASNEVAKEEQGKPYFPISYQTKQVYSNTADKKSRDQLIRIKLN
ncbi:MAG: hypothetical protein EOO13_05625 [Chitinophagaceae bacterium]|nr:MAG: hypothetical protein EOO13_05625 [Chitinophagaceae bacterium]